MEDLEAQAKEMAEKTLPTSLPAAARAAKLPAITQKIFERLKKQREESKLKETEGFKATSTPGLSGGGPLVGGVEASPAPPPPPVPPPPEVLRIPKVELFGDELWFDDPETRRRLRDSVIEAHREEKILVGAPADEVERICPSNGRVLGAGVAWRNCRHALLDPCDHRSVFNFFLEWLSGYL